MRLTKHRKEIIATLKKSHGTLSASDIHKLLPGIDQVTIYRNLDLFVADGVIKKLHLGGSEATYEYQETPHYHALCDNCDRLVHFEANTEALKKQFRIPHFAIKNIEIVLHGTCTHAHSTSPHKTTAPLH